MNFELKNKIIFRCFSSLLVLVTLTAPMSAFADTRQQLLRCADTDLEAGAYGLHYGVTYHGTEAVCGGDTLDKGSIGIVANRFVRVRLDNANTDPFVLYEVYFVPFGADPTTGKTMVGHVMTNCNGDANGLLKDMTTPRDKFRAHPVNIKFRVGDEAIGAFFFYSRGPYGFGDDGGCRPTTLNTSDGTIDGTFNNPVLWEGGAGFDLIQFISGYVTK